MQHLLWGMAVGTVIGVEVHVARLREWVLVRAAEALGTTVEQLRAEALDSLETLAEVSERVGMPLSAARARYLADAVANGDELLTGREVADKDAAGTALVN